MGQRCGFALMACLVLACVEPAPKRSAPPRLPPPGAPDPVAHQVPTPGVTQQGMEIDADASRRTLVIATTDRSLAIVRDGAQHAWPMKQLMEAGDCGSPDAILGYVSVGISPDGQEAWFLGMDGAKHPPFHTLTAACLVDVQSGAARSLRAELGDPAHLRAENAEDQGMAAIALSRRLAVLWGGKRELELVWRISRRIDPLAMGDRDGDCAVVEAGFELIVACVTSRAQGRIGLARFDISGSPPKLITRADLQVRAKYPEIQLSADGRFLAFHDMLGSSDSASMLGVVDTGNGHLSFEREMHPRVHTLEFVEGLDALLVAHDGGPLRLLGVDGHPQGRFGLDCTPRRLFAQQASRRVWCAGYSTLSLYAY